MHNQCVGYKYSGFQSSAEPLPELACSLRFTNILPFLMRVQGRNLFTKRTPFRASFPSQLRWGLTHSSLVELSLVAEMPCVCPIQGSCH